NNGSIGKPSGNDIKEKKLTLPIIHVLKNASGSDRKRILSIVKRQNKNKKKVQEVVSFVIKNGGLEYSTNKMYEFKSMALDILAEMPENESKKSLEELVNYVVIRKK
ncbi:MAG: polyprenyl synthetase family protein, partial [Bacteroidales bacterium]|nr:polyprenyl synthetase family protein [Bacteroidales bacterium]